METMHGVDWVVFIFGAAVVLISIFFIIRCFRDYSRCLRKKREP